MIIEKNLSASAGLACLATTGLSAIFVKVQKAWNVKTADCLRTYLPAVSAVKWKAF